MSRIVVAVSILAAPLAAQACPACTGSASSGPSALTFVFMALPFVVGGLAARAIVRAMRD